MSNEQRTAIHGTKKQLVIALHTVTVERDALQAENEILKKLVYVPGLWRCAKCDFRLLQSNLNAIDGSITAGDQPGDKCPNCDSPLWRVTERQAGNDMVDRCEEQVARACAAVAERDALRQALEEARGDFERMAPMMALAGKAAARIDAILKAKCKGN